MQAAGAFTRPISLQPFGQWSLRAVCGVAKLVDSRAINCAPRLASHPAKTAAQPLGDRKHVLRTAATHPVVAGSCTMSPPHLRAVHPHRRIPRGVHRPSPFHLSQRLRCPPRAARQHRVAATAALKAAVSVLPLVSVRHRGHRGGGGGGGGGQPGPHRHQRPDDLCRGGAAQRPGPVAGLLAGQAHGHGGIQTQGLVDRCGHAELGPGRGAGPGAFFALAAVPSAIFSVWHSISGPLVATLFQRFRNEDDASTSSKPV